MGRPIGTAYITDGALAVMVALYVARKLGLPGEVAKIGEITGYSPKSIRRVADERPDLFCQDGRRTRALTPRGTAVVAAIVEGM